MKLSLVLILVLVPLVTFGAGGSTYPLEQIVPDYTDKRSLQRGLATYSHYCMGCHSLEYQRYERTAIDLGIEPEIMVQAIVPSDKKIGDLGTIAMPAKGAAEWFGAPPPDLTLVTRKRSPDWVYTYMKTFYVDPSRPLGVNNKVYPKVGMPHVLEPLQGLQRAVCADPETGSNAVGQKNLGPEQSLSESHCARLEVVEATAQLSAAEYDRLIYDLVNFLEYVGEPTKAKAHEIGIYVLLFLMLYFVFAYLLKREYWKDVH